MAADRYSLHYCLSETGWTLIDEGSIPDNYVRIYEVEVYQGSPFGPESRDWKVARTNPNWTESDADRLESQFAKPERPRELSAESLRGLKG
jgi:hypothetical protein